MATFTVEQDGTEFEDDPDDWDRSESSPPGRIKWFWNNPSGEKMGAVEVVIRRQLLNISGDKMKQILKQSLRR